GYDSFEELCAVDCFHNYMIRLNNMFIKCASAPLAAAGEEAEAAPQIVIPDLGGGLPDTDAISPVQLQMCSKYLVIFGANDCLAKKQSRLCVLGEILRFCSKQSNQRRDLLGCRPRIKWCN